MNPFTIAIALLAVARPILSAAVPAIASTSVPAADVPGPSDDEISSSISCLETWCDESGISSCLFHAAITDRDGLLGPVSVGYTTLDGTCIATGTTIPTPAPTCTPNHKTDIASKVIRPATVSSDEQDQGSSIVHRQHEITQAVTPTATIPTNCNPRYCENGTSYCHYWAGITGWDSSFNPIPGMTRTSIGSCTTQVADKGH